MKFAGFWIRFGAAIIDSAILMVLFFILEKITGQAFLQVLIAPHSEASANADSGVVLLTYLLWFLYFVVFAASKWQGTPGKFMLMLKITTKEGQRISFARSFARELCTYLSALLLLIGYIMIGFTKEKIGLHDLIAGTRVVFGKA